MAGGGSDEATSFDLTALLDILSNIIFFLMASFGAAVVAVVPAGLPTISDSGENDTDTDTDKVTVTIALAADGTVEISAANNEMLPDELAPFEKSVPGLEGTLDRQAVSDHLWSIKEKFRKSKNVIIVPDDDVNYELLIDAMDASRERRMVVNGQAVYPSMFPAVVVSSKVK